MLAQASIACTSGQLQIEAPPCDTPNGNYPISYIETWCGRTVTPNFSREAIAAYFSATSLKESYYPKESYCGSSQASGPQGHQSPEAPVVDPKRRSQETPSDLDEAPDDAHFPNRGLSPICFYDAHDESGLFVMPILSSRRCRDYSRKQKNTYLGDVNEIRDMTMVNVISLEEVVGVTYILPPPGDHLMYEAYGAWGRQQMIKEIRTLAANDGAACIGKLEGHAKYPWLPHVHLVMVFRGKTRRQIRDIMARSANRWTARFPGAIWGMAKMTHGPAGTPQKPQTTPMAWHHFGTVDDLTGWACYPHQEGKRGDELGAIGSRVISAGMTDLITNKVLKTVEPVVRTRTKLGRYVGAAAHQGAMLARRGGDRVLPVPVKRVAGMKRTEAAAWIPSRKVVVALPARNHFTPGCRVVTTVKPANIPRLETTTCRWDDVIVAVARYLAILDQFPKLVNLGWLPIRVYNVDESRLPRTRKEGLMVLARHGYFLECDPDAVAVGYLSIRPDASTVVISVGTVVEFEWPAVASGYREAFVHRYAGPSVYCHK
jgi:hypothetical protein